MYMMYDIVYPARKDVECELENDVAKHERDIGVKMG